MLQTHSAYMLFYERMKVGETSGGEAVAADISPPDTADGSTAVCRLDADDDDRHKMKIELSPELAEVVDAYSCAHLTTAGHHPPHDTTSQTVSRTFVVTAPHVWNTLPTDSRSQNGLFSGTTRVSQYKGQKTVSGNGISWAICKYAPCSRQITTSAPHHSVFLQAGCPSCRPTNSVKALTVSYTHLTLPTTPYV